jgi:4-hydroxybenzoate polyprenyltransferase
MSCAGASLERVLFALAGTMTILAIVLSLVISPWFVLLAVFVAANQWLYAWKGFCPASLVLGRTPCFTREARR